MHKRANLLDLARQALDPDVVAPLAATWAAGDTLLHRLRVKGAERAPELFEAAYRHGKEGRQINLHTQGALRTVLGRNTNRPAEAGARLGTYMGRRGFSPEEERRYLELLSEAAERNNRNEFLTGMADRSLHRFGKDHVDYAPHLKRMLTGDVDRTSLVARAVDKAPDPITKRPGPAHVAQDIGFAAMAPVTDFRMATRPLLKHVDATPAGRRFEEMLEPDGSKLKRGLRAAKDYIS